MFASERALQDRKRRRAGMTRAARQHGREGEFRQNDGTRGDMMRQSRLLLMGLLMSMSLVGCAGAYKQPEVQLEGIRLGGIGLRGGTLYAQVMVSNPNRFDLETRSLTYDLEVTHPQQAGEWISFAQGTIDERVRVGSRSSTILEVPVQFRYDDMGGALRSILDTGTFNYRVSGDVRLAEPIGRTFPYRKTGTVSMQGVRE
jgi:LEA14-like dessication related protein